MADIDYSLDRIGDRLSGTNLSEHERVLAMDDRVRAEWILQQVQDETTVVDIGCSDGWFAREWLRQGKTVFAVERHSAHKAHLQDLAGAWTFFGEAKDACIALGRSHGGVTVLGEVLEHLEIEAAESLLRFIPTDDLIVTVPNACAMSYTPHGRARHEWPDHKIHFEPAFLLAMLTRTGWNVTKLTAIVGTLTDSIWLGAVCRRSA